MKKSPAEYVNPYIGTISHLLKATVPEVMLPHGIARSYPQLYPNRDYFCNDRVSGFPIGNMLWMPSVMSDSFDNTLDHSRGSAHPYQASILLEAGDIRVESTVTHNCYLYQITGANYLCFSTALAKEVQFTGQTLSIHLVQNNPKRLPNEYLLINFSRPVQVVSQNQEQLVVQIEGSCLMAGSVSYISAMKVKQLLENQVGSMSFKQVAEAAKERWDQLLGKVMLEGNSDDRKTVFYTALYRAFQRMNNYAEEGEYYSAYDGQVHQGDFFFTGDSPWDTFRCMHPLQLLLDPNTQEQILDSYNLMYRQSGLMPSFPFSYGDRPCMIGFHAAPIFADALAKGLRTDYQLALEGMIKNATLQSMLPWVSNTAAGQLEQCYYENGFYPALACGESESVLEIDPAERRQAVSVTLEHSYDDWCVAKIAKQLGKQEEAEVFTRRSQNYRNLYREDLKVMAPKDKTGAWVENFDPKWGGGNGGRDYYTENNGLLYTWSVFHDLKGLISLMGGRKEAETRLDDLFTEGFPAGVSKYHFLNQFPDATGLMGQFAMGNEPSFHIPYIYNLCGAAWKTQKRLRDLMDIWFTNSPIGICGDEDGGAMSSWFVFSAMGFYPVCPGDDRYELGTPLFDRLTLRLDNGKHFSVVSSGAGNGKRYIQSARINGIRLTRSWLRHEEIIGGGELVLEMSSYPNRKLFIGE